MLCREDSVVSGGGEQGQQNLEGEGGEEERRVGEAEDGRRAPGTWGTGRGSSAGRSEGCLGY